MRGGFLGCGFGLEQLLEYSIVLPGRFFMGGPDERWPPQSHLGCW